MALHMCGVNYESLADADGMSCVLFFSGCRHNCVGCHSEETHDFNYGDLLTDDLINAINQEIDKRPFLNCLVLSGGDPMYSAKEIIQVLKKIHIPNNKIWCYSGFTINEILKNKTMKLLLEKCEVLVDGKFEIDKRDITLKFKGSSNQRVIDVQKTLQKGEIVLWN